MAEDLIVALEASILDFEAKLMHLIDEVEARRGDRQPLQEIYARLYKAQDRLKACQEYLSRRLGLKYGEIVPVAGGTLEPKWGKKRTSWDHAALKSVVSERIIAKHVDRDTGVVAAPLSVLMLEMLEAVSISGWKVTILRKLGLDPSKYCDEQPGNFNVIVRFPTVSPIPEERDDAGA